MIPARAALGINRILITVGDVGAEEQRSGTGFWIETVPEGVLVFVTNRHNVDPRMHAGTRDWSTDRVEIELRTDPDGEAPKVERFRVENLEDCLFASKTADCCILVKPRFEGHSDEFRIDTLATEHSLAGQHSDVWRWLDIGDLATFIGFAGRRHSEWWDKKRSLPIGRQASLSSFPGQPFEHADIRTADATLVSGLSFSGASGSPLISHLKTDVTAGFGEGHFTNRVESAILGIMSGHFWDLDETAPPLFQHSGLSYYTRATSIEALIDEARASNFTNEKKHSFLLSSRG